MSLTFEVEKVEDRIKKQNGEKRENNLIKKDYSWIMSQVAWMWFFASLLKWNKIYAKSNFGLLYKQLNNMSVNSIHSP